MSSFYTNAGTALTEIDIMKLRAGITCESDITLLQLGAINSDQGDACVELSIDTTNDIAFHFNIWWVTPVVLAHIILFAEDPAYTVGRATLYTLIQERLAQLDD